MMLMRVHRRAFFSDLCISCLARSLWPTTPSRTRPFPCHERLGRSFV